jgi:hypothetical protein
MNVAIVSMGLNFSDMQAQPRSLNTHHVKTKNLVCWANVNSLYSLLLTINKHVSEVVIMLKNNFLSQSINLEKMTSVDHLA